MQYLPVLCLLLLVSAYAEDPTTDSPAWIGDPNICTVDSSPISPNPPLPKFPPQAEFTLESVQINHLYDSTLPSILNIFEYIYDYAANKVIRVKNNNGFSEVEYYYYELLKKSTYFQKNFCVVSDISTNIDSDGSSAIQLADGTWHVRPLNEYLLFSNFEPNRPAIRPRYIGPSTVRGISVDQWESCITDETKRRTERHTWFFATQGANMPFGVVDDTAVPVQGIINASLVLPNGTQLVEVDSVFNILSYKPGITESTGSLSPPKGVFCYTGADQTLISLSDVGISWPRRFSVRIEVLTSHRSTWQTFHLRFDETGDHKRIRYDFMPVGAEDFRTIIVDYQENLTYAIDRQLGSCEISTSIDYPEVDFAAQPIEFFIKHQQLLVSDPPERAWEINGYRPCRGNGIMCTILTTSVENFPAIVESDTGRPTGDVWQATNIEYAWGIRSPFSPTPPGQPKQFDYPVHLYMKMFSFVEPLNPSPLNIRVEDVEYQFYEMSDDVHTNEFDTSICFRSVDLPYLHLGFVLSASNASLVDSNRLDRRALDMNVRQALVTGLQISQTRISNIELDHIRFDNSVYVLFTLLGPAPVPNTNEPSVESAKDRLEQSIDAGKFMFNMTLLDVERSQVVFTAQAKSLKASKQFMSIHASWAYANLSTCNVSNANVSTCDVSSISPTQTTQASVQRIKQDKYTTGTQVGSIIGGLLVGLVLGGILIIAIRFFGRKTASSATSAGDRSFANRSFHQTRPMPSVSMKTLETTSDISRT